MATLTTSYDAPAARPKTAMLRRMLTGAAAFDAVGGVVCIAAAGELSRWLSIPRNDVYVTGALFLAAATVGALTVRSDPLRVGWIVGANEVFAAWCVAMLAAARPNTLGVAMLAIATLSSAGTGAAQVVLARGRGAVPQL